VPCSNSIAEQKVPPTDRGAYRGGGPIGWGRLIIHHLESDDVYSRSFLAGVVCRREFGWFGGRLPILPNEHLLGGR
jgi:hypothetical protein